MKTAIIVGSFNPITFGHLDIIERTSKRFENVVVGVFKNTTKSTNIAHELRLEMTKRALHHLANVKVKLFEGLAIDFAKDQSGDVFIRGVRDAQDYTYEADLAKMNFDISGIETLFMPADPKHSHIRSSWVRDIAQGAPKALFQFIPPDALTLYLESLNG